MREHIKNENTLHKTIDAPIGAENEKDKNIPKRKLITDIADDDRTQAKKLLKIRIADIAGKITSAEIRSVPIRRIPITTVTATSTDIRAL